LIFYKKNSIIYIENKKEVLLVSRRQNCKCAISRMFCTQCGKEGISIPRKKGQYREPGHLKNLFCIYCQKKQNHVEIRPIYGNYDYEDFLLEMKYHNFDKNGKRIVPFKVFKQKLEQKKQKLEQKGDVNNG
jgi:hypothetical protein